MVGKFYYIHLTWGRNRRAKVRAKVMVVITFNWLKQDFLLAHLTELLSVFYKYPE